MFKLDADISWDTFAEQGAQTLADGQDVTKFFVTDMARPVAAKVILAEGPGGGNPYVSFTFNDEDHAWEWFSNVYLPGEPEEAISLFEEHIANN